MVDETSIRTRYKALGQLNERQRRVFAAVEARAAGYGGVSAVARATGLSRETISRGLKELDAQELMTEKIRRSGAGAKSLAQTDRTLMEDLKRLLEPDSVDSFQRTLWWVTKSQVKLAAALRGMGHQISAGPIPGLLERLHYRRRFNPRSINRNHHSDSDAQFEHINRQVLALQAAGQPIISVDTRREPIEGRKGKGSDAWQHDCRDEVMADDFLGRAIPYGVSDIGGDAGSVSVGINPDTAEFAVNAIRRWHRATGRIRYPAAGRLLIAADGGGSGSSQVRLWKVALQNLADETQLILQVCHYPPGMSRWNGIAHRLVRYSAQDWDEQPLTSHSAVVELIAAATTGTSVVVRYEFDTNVYRRGVEVSDDEMGKLSIKGEPFHPEWNYAVSPRIRRLSK